jgi:alpha-galactosidase
MATKIVLIGAGSAVFTRGLVADMILSPALGPWELSLVDIDPEALETAEKLSRMMIEARQADVSLSASTQRRSVLTGADVVVSTIGVGGRRAWELDVRIPRKHGIYQPVGDTVMPGGISRAMRMIPALVEIAQDVKALCPAARFFNYSNPMTANCRAVRKETGVPVTGLCHGVVHVERELAEFIGASPQEVTALYAGVNHLTFLYELRRNGQDAWRSIRSRIDADPEAFFRSAGNPFSWSIFDRYGAYPAVNDRHVVEFFPERFPGGSYYGKTLGVSAFSFENTIARGDRVYAGMRAQALGEKPLDKSIFDRGPGEHEQLLSILKSMREDDRRIYAANLPNRGAVPGLPPDAVLELPAAATANGLRALQLFDFPPALASLLTRKLAAIELTVEAALSGDRKILVEALLADGAVNNTGEAADLAEELLQAHKAYLPRFFG